MSIPSLFVLMFVIGALVVGGIGMRIVVRARKSTAWPAVSGQVTHSEITRSGSGEGGPSYSALIRYSYTVGGQSLTSERIAFGLSNMSAGHGFAKAYTNRYPVGTSVDVHYDPAVPSEAVLEPGVSKRAFIPLAFAGGFLIFAGWFGLLYWLFRL